MVSCTQAKHYPPGEVSRAVEREARGVPSLQHFPNVQATAQGGGGGWRSVGVPRVEGWMGGWASRLAVGVWGRGAKTAGAKGTGRRAR